jgi:uncharacterized damage-inducible protein DinB
MTQIQIWFDRKFSFTLPLEHFPNVCVRLRGAPARLEEMLHYVSLDVLTRKPAPNKWSAQEHAGHLLDLEPLWTSRVDDFTRDDDTLTIADITNRGTDQANHNARALSDILASFRAARLHLLDRAEKSPAAHSARSKFHPRLKQPMRLIDHLYFVAEHDDHHLARIWELLHTT